jgi:hypothetical protein
MAAAETDSVFLTLCAGCGVTVQLTDAQAVIAEAERVALDVITMAFRRGCCEAASKGDR